MENYNKDLKNCWDVLEQYFTDKEIKEAGEVMKACGCSVCRMQYLMNKFPKRVSSEDALCYGN